MFLVPLLVTLGITSSFSASGRNLEAVATDAASASLETHADSSSVLTEHSEDADHAEGGHQSGLANPLTFIILCFFLSAGVQFLSLQLPTRVRLPHSVLLYVSGMVLSWTVKASNNCGVEWFAWWCDSIRIFQNIDAHVIFWILLPGLLYEDSSGVNWHIFNRCLVPSSLLAIVGVIVNAVMVAGFVQVAMWTDQERGISWNWNSGLLLGAILSATDPVAVVAALSQLHAPLKLSSLIAGESLINDGSSMVLYGLCVKWSNQGGIMFSEVVLFFLRLAIGGVVWGVFCGFIVSSWIKSVTHFALEMTIVLVGFFAAFFMAERETIGVSGVLSVVALGLYMARSGRYSICQKTEHEHHTVLSVVAHLSNEAIFVIAGVVGYRMLEENVSGISDFAEIFVMYLFLHLSRSLVIALFFPILRNTGYGLTVKEAVVMVYGALRGAVGLAMALLVEGGTADLPPALRSRIAFHVSGIVLLTLIINGSTAGWLYRKLKVYAKAAHHDALLYRAVLQAESLAAHYVEDELRRHWFFHNCRFDHVLELVPLLTDSVAHALAREGNVPVAVYRAALGSGPRKSVEGFRRNSERIQAEGPEEEVTSITGRRLDSSLIAVLKGVAEVRWEERYLEKIMSQLFAFWRTSVTPLGMSKDDIESTIARLFDEEKNQNEIIERAKTRMSLRQKTQSLSFLDHSTPPPVELARQASGMINTKARFREHIKATSGQLFRQKTNDMSRQNDQIIRSISMMSLASDDLGGGSYAKQNSVTFRSMRSQLKGFSGFKTKKGLDDVPDDISLQHEPSQAGKSESELDPETQLLVKARWHKAMRTVIQYRRMKKQEEENEKQKSAPHLLSPSDALSFDAHYIESRPSRDGRSLRSRRDSNRDSAFVGLVTSDVVTLAEVFQTVIQAIGLAFYEMYESRALQGDAYVVLKEALEYAQETVNGELEKSAFLNAGGEEALKNIKDQLHLHAMKQGATLHQTQGGVMYNMHDCFTVARMYIEWVIQKNGENENGTLANATGHCSEGYWVKLPFTPARRLRQQWRNTQRNVEALLAYVNVCEHLMESLQLFRDFPTVKKVLEMSVRAVKHDSLKAMNGANASTVTMVEHVLCAKNIIRIKIEALESLSAEGIIQKCDAEHLIEHFLMKDFEVLDTYWPGKKVRAQQLEVIGKWNTGKKQVAQDKQKSKLLRETRATSKERSADSLLTKNPSDNQPIASRLVELSMDSSPPTPSQRKNSSVTEGGERRCSSVTEEGVVKL